MAIRVDSVEDMIPMADFLADVMGEAVEVVLHDITDAESSIVYIRNGFLSGRKAGDGTTDAALRLIHGGQDKSQEYVANYAGKSLENNHFRCATYFVKNREERLIGLLCVNVLTNSLEDAIKTLNTFLYGGQPDAVASMQPSHIPSLEENLLGKPEDTIRRITRTVLANYDVPAERLSRAERLEALRAIHSEGVFLMKGAVPTVAEEMGVSAPTLYKYLQEIRG